ncbi:metallophosphoesterase [Candidatus Sumerlaeota bacterium]|nr:metallophosphoesterase [Candidatus Sumerlaeota bacterium]
MRLSHLLTMAIAACLSGCQSLAPPEPEPWANNEVRFIVFGDSQFNHPGTFERMVHEANLLRPDFVIQVGDLIQGYHRDIPRLREEWERYQFQISPLTVPFYPVPGNHDVITPESAELYGEVWGEDRYVYSFDTGPVHCIVLDTFHGDDDDTLGEWQIEWLTNDLREFAASNGGLGSEELERHAIFLFMHSPLWRYEPSDDPASGRSVWERVQPMLTPYPVRMVFAGHTHECVWEERGGIQCVVLNSSGHMETHAERAGLFHEMIHVSVIDGDVQASVIPAGSALPLDTVNSHERESIAQLALTGGTVRLAPPGPDGISMDVTLPLSNPVTFERQFRLDWEIPEGSPFQIEPLRRTVTVPASAEGESGAMDAPFHVTVDRIPPHDLFPTCTVTDTEMLRSGVVSRDWERRYREDIARAETDPTVHTTSIPLDAPVEFTTQWDIYIPPIVHAARVDEPLTMDGVLNEPAWQRTQVIGDFVTEEGEPAEAQTEVRLLWDDEFLYVSFWMVELNPEGMVANARGDVPLTWADDDVEIFINPDPAQTGFMRFFENCVGTRFNSRKIGTAGQLFVSERESGIQISDDHWILEVAIPHSEIGWRGFPPVEAPEPGDEWSANFWRHRPQSEEPCSQWSVMPGYPYDPGKFGVLVFD